MNSARTSSDVEPNKLRFIPKGLQRYGLLSQHNPKCARFLADVNLDLRIVTGLKRIEPEIDFEAQAAALKGVPGTEVLRIAAEQNRVLVSHDRRKMPNVFHSFVKERESPGLILIK